MDTKTDGKAAPPPMVDLRRGRAPDVEIIACDLYDFLISLRVALASPEFDFTAFDIGRGWIEAARAHCIARDATALDVLGHFLGDGRAHSLHATLISLVWRCPEPRDVPHFLDWLGTLPVNEVVEVLLDQDGLGTDWPEVLAETLASPRSKETQTRLLTRYIEDLWPTVSAVIDDPESTRVALLAALRVWHEAAFAAEVPRLMPMVQREKAALERRRSELPAHVFIQEAMRGVQWERPAGLRRIVLAPCYFGRPAVFYHFWRGTLTFCPPVDDARLEPARVGRHADDPAADILHFFEALGDDTRLRVLHLLSEREMYLTELAERLDLTKATTKHHMVKLRAAGLVTLYDRERLTYYALRPDVARHAQDLLEQYLGKRES
ncbi:MAG TPA: winged helix-turn-helix domain-containing protein [Ktedonobacterales bacterium]|nr:winged helix-turn-helix domain-containing protein [Ktedonobacterales bacterium]